MSDPYMRCSMTGLPIADSSEGIWDDGEWVSWAWINDQIALQERQQIHVEFPKDAPQPEAPSLRRLVSEAASHDEANPGTPSPLWGKIGELYVAERFGVVLSRDHAQGHDGRLGDELVEIKTITPHKERSFVRVKRNGNFSVLAIIRVDEQHRFDARLIRRNRFLKDGDGKYATLSWSTACNLATDSGTL
jgi:hypothetical protein